MDGAKVDGAKSDGATERQMDRATERRSEERRSDGATDRRSNRAIERRSVGATERQKDEATERQNKDFAMIKLLAQNPRQYGPCVRIFSCPYCRIFGKVSIGRRGLWCPWGCVGWLGARMMMKLLSGISAILAVLYG